MARVDFRIPSSGVRTGTKVLLDSQGSDIGTASGDLFNQGGVPKWHNGTATKTLAYTDSNITGSAASWTTARTITLGGDLSGSVSINGTADVTLNATIAADSIALGTDTTGNYIATITGTSNQVTVTGSGSESATVTLSLPQDIATSSSPSFVGITLSGDLAVNGGDITTTSTGTATVFNTNATTLNIGGAATAVSIGASSGTTTVNNALTVTGNLTVNGTTTTVNSTTTTVDDPIFTLGGDGAAGSDDNKDRGIEFHWHNGTVAKLGFFGFDDSTQKFTFIPDATNTSEVFSGTAGTVLFGTVETSTLLVDNIEVDTTGASTNQVLQYNGTKFAPATLSSASSFTTIAVSGQNSVVADASADTLTLVNGTGITITTNDSTDSITVTNSGVTSIAGTTNEVDVSASTGAITISLPTTINANTTGSAAKWTTERTITLGGDLSGSVNIDGSANVTLTATIASNSVALGTDTTGDYVASLVAGTGVAITNNSGEGATPTIAIGQAVGTSDSPTFAALSLADGATTALEDFDTEQLSTTSQTAIVTLSATTYRSVKYVVQASQGSNYMVTEILAVHNGTSADYVEYGTITIGTAPATFDVAVVTGNIVLRATGASSSATTYQIRTTALPA